MFLSIALRPVENRGLVRYGDRGKAGARRPSRFRRRSCVIGRCHGDLHGLDRRGFKRIEIGDTRLRQDHLPLLQRKVSRVFASDVICNSKRDGTAITIAADGIVE